MAERTKIKLGEQIGKGNQGAVYMGVATIKGQERQVAVKVITKESNAYRETAILKRLPEHKNLVKLLEGLSSTKGVLLVFEYISDAKDMTKYRSESPLSTRSLDVFYQIADGVSALHAFNILHRDLKPANVMLKGTVPFIIDYGSACSLDSLAGVTACTGWVGTPNYMAPEVWTDKRYSYESDIYSLGATFYMLVSRTPPYPSDAKKDVVEVLRKLITDPDNQPKMLVCNISALTTLVMRMIDKSAKNRPQIKEVKEKLADMIKQS